MARRKKKRSTKSRAVVLKMAGSSQKKRKRNGSGAGPRLKAVGATIRAGIVAAGLVAAVGAGFMFLERYVGRVEAAEQRVTTIELVDVPAWVSKQLEAKVYAAATAGIDDFKLDKSLARMIQQNVSRSVCWLDEVRVVTTHRSIRISGRWRQPVALVKLGVRRFYVDAEMVVLDYVPLDEPPIVKVTGLSALPQMPERGKSWQQQDVSAAVTILTKLRRMDRLVTPDKPLLAELDRIDVSNFKGRQNRHAPHIIMYARDNTEIIWGAEYGRWQRYLESTDKQKIAKLYQHYKEYGTLLGRVKYINLCDPRDDIPLPIERY